MKRAHKPVMFAAAVLILSLAASVVLLRRLDAVRHDDSLREVLYISSPKGVKRLSLGYNGLMADIYWTRAVQYFGRKHSTGTTDYKLLRPLLEIATELDPQLLVAYEYGSNFLTENPPQGAGDSRGAVKLVQFGIKNNPQQWRLYYNLGFIYYLNLKDYKAAAEAFATSSRLPRAHPFTRVLAGNMAQHAGEYGMSRMLWTATLESTQERSIRANAVAHLAALQVDEDVDRIERAAADYREKLGTWPSSLSALAQAGFLPGVPLDPDRHPYQLAAEGRVEVRNPDSFPFITKGTPPGYKAPAPNLARFVK